MKAGHLEHDLFLLMLNLSQFEDLERIKDHFIEALNSIWVGADFSYVSDGLPSDGSSYEITTLRDSFGYIRFRSDAGRFSSVDRSLVLSDLPGHGRSPERRWHMRGKA